jgi:hypothetical protein
MDKLKTWRWMGAVRLALVVLGLFAIAGAPPGQASAEPATPPTTQETPPVVMVALPWDDPSIRIPPSRTVRAALAPTTVFSINYLSSGTQDGYGTTCTDWSPAAQAAFSYAASLWAPMITSVVPIRINACWAALANPSLLGYSGAWVRRDWSGAPQSGTWYTYSLADALAGSDLDPANPDITATFNSSFSWYFGTDGLTPAGQHDFVTVVLHEIGHGLNFAGTMSYGAAQCGGASIGCWGFGSGFPGIYDRHIVNGDGQALLNPSLFPNSSAALGSQLTGGSLYFDGPNADAANCGSPVRIYAPSPWAPGSSYAHLDFNTFQDTPNRLMVYALPSASSIHDPGPLSMGLLKDVGWTTTTGAPIPAISGLSPSSATEGSPNLTLIVKGSNFVSGAVVRWNGSDRPTSCVSGAQLSATITAADIASAGPESVTVFNPGPGGGESNAALFLVARSRVYLPLALR